MPLATDTIYKAARRVARIAAKNAVSRGANPSWFSYRVIETESLEDYAKRHRKDPAVELRTIHGPRREKNALPLNISDRDTLPDDAGWWHYSFRDVPSRLSGKTTLARLPDARIVPRIDEKGEFWVTVLNNDGRSCLVREMALRKEHRDVLVNAETQTFDEAVWMLERVYDNYSHWFTAHMPKLLLLRELDLHTKVLLPQNRPRFIDNALKLYGFDPEAFPTFDPSKVLHVKNLTLIDTDRFRPGMLSKVRRFCPNITEAKPNRRVFISREGAARRRLVNEQELWPILEKQGFERVRMEELSFEEQVWLMQETSVLCAPHGAGMTNMMFCHAGTQIIEMADLSFPNPNFYAVASAMKHDYWLISAEGVGDGHPLEKDMRVDADVFTDVLERSLRKLASRS